MDTQEWQNNRQISEIAQGAIELDVIEANKLAVQGVFTNIANLRNDEEIPIVKRLRNWYPGSKSTRAFGRRSSGSTNYSHRN